MTNLLLNSPITSLNGVGKVLSQKLAAINLHTIEDLLFCLPYKYLDKTRLTLIKDTIVGDSFLIQATIVSTKVVFKPRKMFVITAEDSSGKINVRLFYFNHQQTQSYKIGTLARFFGEVRFNGKNKELIHPQINLIKDALEPLEQSLTPVYPTTKGVSQGLMQKLLKQVLVWLPYLENSINFIPESILDSRNLMSLKDALQIVHSPSVETSMKELLNFNHTAQKRLALEEITAYQVALKYLRKKSTNKLGYKLETKLDLVDKYINSLDFNLTSAQNRVFNEVSKDLNKSIPMRRLIQGDVGCGKTVIIIMSSLVAVANGYQVAIMAPTAILAQQHFSNFSKWSEALGVKITLLTGKLSIKNKENAKNEIMNADIVIGTHALFQDGIQFNHLSLIIIDEQHRFGVEQRLALMQKNSKVEAHQLILSATPIPRTLAMTYYADLDCSVIDEVPVGRKQIVTTVLDSNRREELIEKMLKIISAGGQVYWICPLVAESENMQLENAEDLYINLKKHFDNKCTVGLIHGKLNANKKEQIMDDFVSNKINILVATTVIEVGVDVPNANIIIIENADRFGLSQLHQLRGRVGRGDKPSNCLLLYSSPISHIARRRLEIMRSTSSGFDIAEEDLKLRGPGDVVGMRQSGMVDFKVANLVRDKDMLPIANGLADKILLEDKSLIYNLTSRWVKTLTHYLV